MGNYYLSILINIDEEFFTFQTHSHGMGKDGWGGEWDYAVKKAAIAFDTQ
jgi:hypothetical protein